MIHSWDEGRSYRTCSEGQLHPSPQEVIFSYLIYLTPLVATSSRAISPTTTQKYQVSKESLALRYY